WSWVDVGRRDPATGWPIGPGMTDCPSPTLCVALGSFDGADVYESTDPSGTAAAWAAGRLHPGADDVSCATTELCIAVAGDSVLVGRPGALEPIPPDPPPTPAPLTTQQLADWLSAQVAPRGKVARISYLRRHSRVSVGFAAPGAGVIAIDWRVGRTLLAHGTHSFARPGVGTIRLRLTS